MGWLKDLWSDIVSWIRDKVLQPVVDYILSIIVGITDTLRWLKHKFFEKMAEWLENDLFFIAAIAATIVAAVYMPKILKFLAEHGLSAMLKKMWGDIAAKIGTILKLETVLNLQLINQMLKTFWPAWKDINAQFAEVTSALAADLGEGSAYIHAYFSAVHGLAIVGNSFLGTDPKLATMQAFEDTEAKLRDINKKFTTYNLEPGKIVTDIVEDIYLKYGTQISDGQTATLAEVKKNRADLESKTRALEEFDVRLSHFIDIQPEEMKDIVEDRLGTFSDALHEGLVLWRSEVLTKVDSVINLMEEQNAFQQRVNAGVISRLSDPYGLLLQGELYGVEERENFEDYLSELNRRAEERQTAGSSEVLAEFAAGVYEGLKREVPSLPPPSLAFELPRIPAFPSHAASNRRDWFVGEF